MSDGFYVRRAVRTLDRIETVSSLLCILGSLLLFAGIVMLLATATVLGVSLLGGGAVLLAAGIRLECFVSIKCGELEAMREIINLNKRTLEILETTFVPPKKKKRRKRAESIEYSEDDETELSDEDERKQAPDDVQNSDASVVSDEETPLLPILRKKAQPTITTYSLKSVSGRQRNN